jgi:hypothetical protein
MKATLGAAVLAVILVTHPAGAQRAPSPPAGGLALLGGAGVGWTRAACGFCQRQLRAGPVLYFQGTGRVRPNLAVGAEANAWVREDEVFILMGSLGLIAHLWPRVDGPLYLKGGLSYVTYRAYDDEGDLVANSPGMQLGAGYTFRISDGITLTSFVNLLASRFGTLRSEDDVVAENFGVMSLQLGIGIAR